MTGHPSWPKWRAALLAVVVAAHGVAALPLPHAVRPQELRDPVARDEVRRWAERLTALGYTIDDAALGERVVSVTGWIGGAHRRVLAPVRPWFRWTGTGQGWALFANPDTHPNRIQVAVHRGGTEEVIYLRGDPTKQAFAPWIESRRIRPVYDAHANRSRPTPEYRRYVVWLSNRIRASDPTVEAVSVSLIETHTPARGAAARPPRVRHTVQAP